MTIKHDRNTEFLVSNHEVFWDLTWNSRSDLGESSGGPESEEDTGLGEIDKDGGSTGLIRTIVIQGGNDIEKTPGYVGQLSPVFLRPRRATDTFPKQYKYYGVAGFRRAAAINAIAAFQGDKKAMIRAKAWSMTDGEARELNLMENAARQNLSGPDLAFGVERLLKDSTGLTQTAVAGILNRDQSYVSKLWSIVTKVKGQYEGMPILTHWRKSPASAKVGVDAMYKVAGIEDTIKQGEKYAELVRPKDRTNDQRTPEGKVNAATKQAQKYGKAFGVLVREGLVTLEDERSFFTEALSEFMTLPKETEATTDEKTGKAVPGITKADIRSVVKAAYAAFKVERDRVETEEEETEEEEEETPKAKGKGKKGNASASAN